MVSCTGPRFGAVSEGFTVAQTYFYFLNRSCSEFPSRCDLNPPDSTDMTARTRRTCVLPSSKDCHENFFFGNRGHHEAWWHTCTGRPRGRGGEGGHVVRGELGAHEDHSHLARRARRRLGDARLLLLLARAVTIEPRACKPSASPRTCPLECCHARWTVGTRTTLLATERRFWQCGANTAKLESLSPESAISCARGWPRLQRSTPRRLTATSLATV